MDELQWRAAKYMYMEELVEYNNKVQVEAMSNKKEVDKPNFNKTREEGQRDRPSWEPRAPITPPSAKADLTS